MDEPVSAAVGAALRADMPSALALLRGLDERALSDEDRALRGAILDRFDRPAPPHDPPATGDDLADRLVARFRDYWWRALSAPEQATALAGKLHAELGEAFGVRTTTVEALEAAGLRALEQRGIHGLMGVTSPLRELLLWRRQDTRTYEVELPEGPQTTRVELLDDVVSFGWAEYATCGKRATGGWATSEALFAVVPRYRDGLDGEPFRVTFLGHESQHLADLRRFGDLPQWVLEYRAKLVELAQADTSRPQLLEKFTESQSDDPGIPHAYANRRVIQEVAERLRAATGSDDLAAAARDDLSRAALAALEADTASRLTRAGETPATLALSASGTPHTVVRTERARTADESAAFQGIEARQLIRTIVVRRGEGDYLFVLVPAGRRFDWPKLRALLGISRMSLPDAAEARAVTGYERGAITPFGSTTAWPVIADASLVDLPRVAIGGGAHGVNVHLTPADLVAATGATVADVTTPEDG